MATTAGQHAGAEATMGTPDADANGNDAATSHVGPSPEPEWLPIKDPVKALVNDIKLVANGGRIMIFCGEAHPSIYSDAAFMKKARKVVWERGARIEVITGPILLDSESSGARNGILTLWEEEVVSTLFHRRARYASSHFRVVETDLTKQQAFRYYAEAPHPPLLPMKDRLCENLDRLHPADVHQRALQARDRFDAWKEQSTRQGAADHPELPYVTTATGLRTLMREAAERDLVFKYLDDAQMLELLPSARELLTPYPEYRSASTNGVRAGHR